MNSGKDDLTVGFPHSEIHGSKPARGSPWLSAACHVLHRLLAPRHPPNALLTLELPYPRTGRITDNRHRVAKPLTDTGHCLTLNLIREEFSG